MKRLFIVFLLPLLAGCMAGPNYRKPDLPTAKNWVEATDKTPVEGKAAPSAGPWWTVLGDETLNALEQRALVGNLDVRMALARIKEARAGQIGAVANLLPNSSGQLSHVYTQPNSGYGYKPQTQTQENLSISWEIDLLGGNRRELEARIAEREAALLNRDSALLIMSVELARTYVQLRDAVGQITVLQANIDSEKEIVRLTTLRAQYGLGSDLEVAQAGRQLASTEAGLPPLFAARAKARYQLELLLGELPGTVKELDQIATGVSVPEAKVVLAAPGDLLVRRPDVAIAERRLAAAVARQGVTRAEWLPRISLSALLGNIFTFPPNSVYPVGETWMLGAQATQTLLDFGRIASEIRVSDARADQALINLKQCSLTAFAEVETALAAYGNSGKRLSALTETEAKAQKAFDLSRQLYLDGLGQFLDVLDAQRELLAAQQTRQAAEASVVGSIIDLESAMGGATFAEKPEPDLKKDPPLMMLSVPQKIDPSLSNEPAGEGAAARSVNQK